MDIKEQVFAKQKAYDVVHSCKTMDQCQSARNYIENYLELTEDSLGYNYLTTELLELTEDIEEQLRLIEEGNLD